MDQSKMITPTNDNSIPPLAVQDRMQIVFKDLSYRVQVRNKENIPGKKGPFKSKTVVKDKVILHNVSGYFREGRVTAVMGASGAGKTSLLQLLAGEVRSGDISGTISVNGQSISGEQMKTISGFVFQDDVILATMTVREAISMSASLRLPQTLSQQERTDRVDGMLKLLNLEKCANTIIGSATLKGISGGERKRCAIAMELITNPAVLFLDEPTSGLDSFTAYSAIDILKKLAHDGGRTVIATIHQPSSEIFHLFDDLLLLADGRVIYQGEIEKAVSYFGTLGYVCPTYVNPSDFIFMSILNNEEGNNSDPYGSRKGAVETNRERITRLLNVWTESPEHKEVMKVVDHPRAGGITRNVLKQISSFSVQFNYLYQRASKNALRNPMIIRAKFGQALVFGLIIGLLYLNTQDKVGYVAFQDRTGVLFFLAVNTFFSSSFGILAIFGQEKTVFSREFGAGYYGLAAYFLSKIGVETPFYIVFPWIQATITYWMVGLQIDAGKYFLTCVISVLCAFSGFALGIFFACVFPSLEMALAITPVVLLPLMLFSGLFINQNAIPVFLNWIKWLSPIRYGFEGMAKNEFTGLVYPGDAPNSVVYGETNITQLGFNDGLTIGLDIAILCAFVVFLMSMAYFSLWRLTSKNSQRAKLTSVLGKKGGKIGDAKAITSPTSGVPEMAAVTEGSEKVPHVAVDIKA